MTAAPLALDQSVRMAVYVRDNGICGICGQPVEISDFQLDHVIPISRGGIDQIGNLQTSHKACNIAKGNTLPGESRVSANKGNHYGRRNYKRYGSNEPCTKTMAFSLPPEMPHAIELLSDIFHLSKSCIVTLALETYLNRPDIKAQLEKFSDKSQ